MSNNNVKIGNLKNHYGNEVGVSGWVNNVRDKKNIQFLVLSDDTGYTQAINFKDGGYLDKTISNLPLSSTVYAEGKVIENPSVKLGGLELDEIIKKYGLKDK